MRDWDVEDVKGSEDVEGFEDVEGVKDFKYFEDVGSDDGGGGLLGVVEGFGRLEVAG